MELTLIELIQLLADNRDNTTRANNRNGTTRDNRDGTTRDNRDGTTRDNTDGTTRRYQQENRETVHPGLPTDPWRDRGPPSSMNGNTVSQLIDVGR